MSTTKVRSKNWRHRLTKSRSSIATSLTSSFIRTPKFSLNFSGWESKALVINQEREPRWSALKRVRALSCVKMSSKIRQRTTTSCACLTPTFNAKHTSHLLTKWAMQAKRWQPQLTKHRWIWLITWMSKTKTWSSWLSQCLLLPMSAPWLTWVVTCLSLSSTSWKCPKPSCARPIAVRRPTCWSQKNSQGAPTELASIARRLITTCLANQRAAVWHQSDPAIAITVLKGLLERKRRAKKEPSEPTTHHIDKKIEKLNHELNIVAYNKKQKNWTMFNRHRHTLWMRNDAKRNIEQIKELRKLW